MTKNTSIRGNVNKKNYFLGLTPGEPLACGSFLYIANQLSYKPWHDLNIYNKNKLESTFIEIINPKKSNIIVGCIYKTTFNGCWWFQQ